MSSRVTASLAFFHRKIQIIFLFVFLLGSSLLFFNAVPVEVDGELIHPSFEGQQMGSAIGVLQNIYWSAARLNMNLDHGDGLVGKAGPTFLQSIRVALGSRIHGVQTSNTLARPN